MSKTKFVNISSLIALADTASTSEIKKEFNVDMIAPDIREALAEIKAEEKKLAARAAAREIYSLIEMSQAMKVAKVQQIRSARMLVEASKQELDEIAAAEKYAAETNNYLPLCKVLGVPTFGANPVLTQMPVKAAAKTAKR